ncbi:DUF642 domain-containing protein [Marinobacter sp. MIT932201]|uniref:DUF642 domain-containing protein n=1 Tax=Marinobacter sp. MIT932201 TaxID=3096995 RepID=UPI00399B9069
MVKMKSLGAAVGLTALMLSPIASANLLTNGSFEESPELTQAGGGWGFFNPNLNPNPVPGWGSEDNNIEIWNSGFNGVTAADGQQFAELNAHPETGNAFTLFQDVVTTIGESYNLSFAYRARNGQESFNVSVANLDEQVLNTNTGEWTIYSGMFTAQEELTRLMFTSVDPETETLGNFIDNVSIVARVPEPGTLALLSLGLAGLGVFRRRRN